MRNRFEIETILIKKVNEKTQAHQDARDYLEHVTSEIPSSLPLTEGAVRVNLAGEAHQSALSELRAALNQWHEFTINGVIPEYLKD